MDGMAALLTLVGGLGGALVFGYLAHRVRLSPIVGYLVAGIAVGPFTPGFVANRQIAEQFAEIGVILLLFGIGLRFHLRELVSVWRIAVPGALLQCALSTGALALLLHAVGWSWRSGLLLGMAVSVASTVVMALVLAERRDLRVSIGHVAMGWTVVEDLITVGMLLALPIVFAPGSNRTLAASFGLALLDVLGLVATVIVAGRWVIPWALERIERTRSRELFTLAVLVFAVGIAVVSARGFGVSMALGAFLAGLAVGRSDFAARAAADAVPMRDAFAVLFFVSVGMMFDPRSLVRDPVPTGLVLLVVLVIKPLTSTLMVRASGLPLSTAAPVGAAVAQVGEFSFILGGVARGLGLLDEVGWNAIVGASILSIAINPTLYRLTRRLTSAAKPAKPSVDARPPIDPQRCVLVGYGPVGRIVRRLLEERGALLTVVDLNLETVRALREEGCTAVYGDVLRAGTLEEAGLGTAGSLVLSADVEDSAEIIRQARLLNPELRVFVRCTHLRDAEALRRAGAQVVACGEAEVGVALAEAFTSGDGLEPDLGSARREAVRSRLYGSRPPA